MTNIAKEIISNLLKNYKVFNYGNDNMFIDYISTGDICKISDAKDAFDDIIEKMLEKHQQYDEMWMDSNTFFMYLENEDNETVLLNAFYGGGGVDGKEKFNPNDPYFMINVYGHYYSCGWRDYTTIAHDYASHFSDFEDDTEVEDAIDRLLDILDIDDTE